MVSSCPRTTMAATSSSPWLLLPRGGRLNSDGLFASALSLAVDDVLGLLITLALTLAYLSRGYLWDKKDPLYHLWFEKPQANLVTSGPQAKTRNIATKLEDSASDLECHVYPQKLMCFIFTEERHRYLLGISIWHRREACCKVLKRTAKSIWC